MNAEEKPPAPNGVSPFERIRGPNTAGAEFWSSRDFAQVLGYADYRNFEKVTKRAKTACLNSGQRIEDHFVEITEGGGGQLSTLYTLDAVRPQKDIIVRVTRRTGLDDCGFGVKS